MIGAIMTEPLSSDRPADEKEERIVRYMKRMKTALRHGTRSNRASVASMSEIVGESSKSEPKPEIKPEAKPEIKSTTVPG
jgi:hypothetical protein